MKFEPEEFPIREYFLKTGLQVDKRFDGFLDRARDGGEREKYEFAYVLHTLSLRGRELRPDVIPADTCDQSLQSALEIFEDLGSHDHPSGCLMAAKSWIGGQGCQKDSARARKWLEKAESLGCRHRDAIAHVWTMITAADTSSAPAARTGATRDLHHQYDQ